MSESSQTSSRPMTQHTVNLRERNLPPFWGSPRTAEKLVVEVPQSGQFLHQVSLEDARTQDPGVNLGDTLEMVSGPGTRAGGSSKFLLGTDELGRDILSRIVFGARISIIVSVVTLVIGGGLGVFLGLSSGWYGGWIDEVIMRLVDIILSLPLILVALVMVSAFGQSLELIIGVLAIWIWPRFARQVRGEVLQLKTMDYVSAARIAGASIPRILFNPLASGDYEHGHSRIHVAGWHRYLAGGDAKLHGRGCASSRTGLGLYGSRRPRPPG